MLPDHVRAAIRPTIWRLNLIWLGNAASFAVYFFIAHSGFGRAETDAMTGDSSSMRIVFTVFGLITLLAGIALKGHTFSQTRAHFYLSKKTKSTNAPPANRKEAEDALILLGQRTFQVSVMAFGMINTTVLFGMMLSLQLRDIGAMIPFLVCGGVGWFLCQPNLNTYLENALVAWELRSATQIQDAES